jgi:polar amino acid transport system substrate-binding protein
MGVPKSYGDEAASYLANFVEEMKRSGFVDASLKRHRIDGAAVAKEGD